MDTAELTIEGLVHDLNNVFQTIGESAELLASDPKWARLAATLQRSVERGQRIAHSIVEHKRTSDDFAAIVENAIQFVVDYLEIAHGPAVVFERAIEPGFRVPGDAAGWERVLVNLFMNSAEAGGRRISVIAAGHEITITDDGPGIPPELLSRIFQPHISTKAITSGLGLFVVRSIVEESGGRVSAANGEHGGAIFRIQLGGVASESQGTARGALE
jgi:signal transduction histidine kinase